MTSIPRDVVDPFYRYKRLILPVNTIAKNGVTTVVSWAAFSQLCTKHLKRDPKEVVKHLKRTLKLCVAVVPPELWLKGKVSRCQLDDAIESYIEKHVLCKKCGNPETIPEKEGKKCKACGEFEGWTGKP